jgi:hypothetical protein
MRTELPVRIFRKSHALIVALSVVAFLGSSSPCRAIVGYVNVALQPGLTLLCNPLEPGAPGLGAILGGPDGTVVYRWNYTNQSYAQAGTRVAGLGWISAGVTNDTNVVIAVGEGFWVESPTAWTNTFIGELVSSPATNPIYANYNLLGCKIPIGGSFTNTGSNAVNFPSLSSDQVWKWNGSFSNYTRGPSSWNPAPPSINVGEGVLISRSPANATQSNWWVMILDFQPVAQLPAALGSTASSGATTLEQLAFEGGEAVLHINNPNDAVYNVEFSTDGNEWQTLASGLREAIWRGPVPNPILGYFRVINP